MNRMNATLKPLVKGAYPSDIRYLVCSLRIVLSAGKFPKNLCSLVAVQEEATRYAVRKGFSRIAKTVWDNSVGVLHKEKDQYPGPLNVLRELAYLISGGEIM